MGTPDRIADAIRLATDSPAATMELGARLAECLEPGDILGLVGTLGAGKTCLAKGIARGLGVDEQRRVISPSYVLMRQYQGRLTLSHFDAYRLESAAQMEEIGCQETFDGGGVSVIEWADHVASCLPPKHILITIRVTGPVQRQIVLNAAGRGSSARLRKIGRALAPWVTP